MNDLSSAPHVRSRECSSHPDETSSTSKRPVKRVKFADAAGRQSPTDTSDHLTDAVDDTGSSRLEHPFGVKPIGNYFDDAEKGIRDCRGAGLGRLGCLSDVVMLQFLNYLVAEELCAFSATSRAAYVFGSHDELWRTLVLEELEGNFTPKSTWKQSYIASKTGREELSDKLRPIQVQGLYSDLLFQAYYCASAPIEKSWLAVENIDRRSANKLSVEDFKQQYEAANRPVILTECIDKWPAMDKWTDEYLISKSAGETFSAGGFQLPMEKYLHYSRTLTDDQPLFIFDKEFSTKVPPLAADYSVPAYFQEDFFALLGPDKRPDHRWLIIGPKRSGSSFHIDPNSTNAWNGVIRGAKKWILFPPEIVPPGVHPSEDGSDVTTPVSLIEWFVTFYPQVKKLPAHQRPLEGVCRAGEIIFVPNGWWHLVLNTEESIAITQNFVCQGNLTNVVRFLEEKPDQVSGLPMERRPFLGAQFRAALQQHEPARLAAVDEVLAQERARKNRKSKWELLLANDSTDTAAKKASDATASTTPASTGFSFSFCF